MTTTKETREFSGRIFNEEDMELIKDIAGTYPKLSRAELANTICELLGWVQANGKPKTTQCIRFMCKLEDEGEVRLPALNNTVHKGGIKRSAPDLRWIDMSHETEFGPIELEIIRPGERLRQWRTYLDTYHRLGSPSVYGGQLRYMIKAMNGRDLGCMQFSASSWALRLREEWIGWGLADRKARLHLVVNQSRYLIFPWIHIRNLASCALAMAAKRIQGDWLEAYCYAPVLLETFVDSSLYKGTAYKAANWTYLGETQGRGRYDRHHENALTRKAIYMYPLQRDFRAVLKGEKPWKAVEPHV